MQSDQAHIANRIRLLRIAKDIKQSELDEKAQLPRSSVSKIETLKREATASEFVRIAQALGVTLDVLVSGLDAFVYQEEIKVIEALRVIPFEDYKSIIGTLEARVYFAAKDAKAPLKDYMEELRVALMPLAQSDRRPRSQIADKKRVK
jgi:transcriptional regulator with XRE-family HTH domain